jgi:hypothetical protein
MQDSLKGAVMNRNLLRVAALVFVLATTFWLSVPRPALAILCGSGSWFVPCTKKCCGPGVTTTYSRSGAGNDCQGAKAACGSCLPACPAGQTLCGSTMGVCMS